MTAGTGLAPGPGVSDRTHTRHRPKRYRVVLNAHAGITERVPGLEERLRTALGHGRDAHVEVVRCATPEEASRDALAARRGDWDAVIAVGGDGTHHWLLDGLAGSDVPLGLIPLGTANDLASEHEIPVDVEGACEVIRRGATTRLDLVETAGKAFATAGGMGLATDIALGVCAARQRWPVFRLLMQLLGAWIYTLYMVLTVLFARRLGYRYRVEGADGEVRDVDGYMAIVMNQAFLGKNFQAAPRARNDDGAFDVFLLKKVPWRFARLRLLATLCRTMNGSHVGRRDVEVFRARRLELETPAPVPFFADGELVAEARRFSFRVRPRALRLLVPPRRAGALRLPEPLLGSGLHAA